MSCVFRRWVNLPVVYPDPAEPDRIAAMKKHGFYVKDVDKAISLANNATDKGYECTINIMAISHEGAPFLDEALQQIERVRAVAFGSK